MSITLTLEYWKDAGGFVGRISEVPGVFSQGETLEELERNVVDAYRLVLSESRSRVPDARTKPLDVAI